MYEANCITNLREALQHSWLLKRNSTLGPVLAQVNGNTRSGVVAYHLFFYALLILWFSVRGKSSTKKTGVKNPFHQTLIAAQRSPPSAKSITRHSQPERTKTSSGYGRCFFIQIFSNQKNNFNQPTNQPTRTNPHLYSPTTGSSTTPPTPKPTPKPSSSHNRLPKAYHIGVLHPT